MPVTPHVMHGNTAAILTLTRPESEVGRLSHHLLRFFFSSEKIVSFFFLFFSNVTKAPCTSLGKELKKLLNGKRSCLDASGRMLRMAFEDIYDRGMYDAKVVAR